MSVYLRKRIIEGQVSLPTLLSILRVYINTSFFVDLTVTTEPRLKSFEKSDGCLVRTGNGTCSGTNGTKYGQLGIVVRVIISPIASPRLFACES